ncbi:hypothetical protein COV93_03200 [Candidatus Woesearchaeota archaeon CG11_big_fil_rev_8_21_14_0_20_43_8]|nr:MAG: hypothetical protein COV93_03200 [Candidatus Woesearchaeota archaeon CG11_big_fil_rev_8_21_14_0_20_43_8]
MYVCGWFGWPRSVSTMQPRRVIFGLAGLLVIILAIWMTDEATALVQNVTQGEIILGDASTMVVGLAGQIFSEGGNLTEINISTKKQTPWFQGIYGSLTLNLTLEDASGDVFYNWGDVDVSTGEIYISNDTLMAFDGTISAANDKNVTFAQEYWGWANSTGIDNLTNTYAVANGHRFFLMGTVPIFANSAASVNLANGLFNCTMLWKDSGTEHPLYAALVNSHGTAYNGQSANFECLLPVRSENGVEQYLFYTELY